MSRFEEILYLPCGYFQIKIIFMKKHLILIICLNISLFSFSQENDAKKNYELGTRALDKKKYEEAVKYLTLSIAESPVANAYYNRAVAYYYLGDSCSFCNGLIDAAMLNDKGAEELYKSKCMYSTTVKTLPDSLRGNYPPISKLVIEHHKCLPDSVVYCVQEFKFHTETIELSKYKSISLEEYNKIINDENETFVVVEEMPEYPGGMAALTEFVATNLQYPEEAKKAKIEGRVFVHFVVEKDGSIKDVKVLKGLGYGCDEEAIRVATSMPKWKPGKQRGKEVRVAYNLPIRFTLP